MINTSRPYRATRAVEGEGVLARGITRPPFLDLKLRSQNLAARQV